jgi:hypothetical protein
MRANAFEMPDLTQVENIMVERLNETTLKPDSPVICVNRGRQPLQVTFNAEHLTVPVGHFRTEYAAAMHMQRHLIVPGTRNLEVGAFVSWVAILGSDDGRVAVDPPDQCVPFTDEELQQFGEKIEGLASDGRDPLVPLRTSAGRAMSRGQGVANLRPNIDAREQGSAAAAEAAAHVFDAPEGSLTREAEAQAGAERGSEPAGVEPVPQPRPMGKRR